MIIKSDHPWAAFLYHRARAIRWLQEDGKSDEEIARILSMDTIQVTLISMTPLEELEESKK